MRARFHVIPAGRPCTDLHEQLISFVERYLQGRATGAVRLQSSRTSAAFRLDPPGLSPGLFVKIYTYKTLRQVLRGFIRNTFLGRSRAKREWLNLHRLRAIGCPTPEPVAVLELRRWRALRACALATRFVAGAVPADRFFLTAPPPALQALTASLARLVARMHAAGYTDGDLHLRNLLVVPPGPDRDAAILKIDSPKGRMTAAWKRRIHDLACLEVGARRLVPPARRLRFFLAYAAHLGVPRSARERRRWVAAAVRRAEDLEAKEGPRMDALRQQGVR